MKNIVESDAPLLIPFAANTRCSIPAIAVAAAAA
jgi:hypothetical protein